MIDDNQENNWKCRMSAFSFPELVELGKSDTPLHYFINM
jgi:hypothetical protein